MDIPAIIRSVTREVSLPLLPELSLRLVTSASPWWRLSPEELSQQGVPEPYWAFAWGGGQALARYILDHPDVVRDKDVIDFGAGGGIVTLAALRAGARSVRATEVDRWALFAFEMNLRHAHGEAFRDRASIVCEDWIGRVLKPGEILLCGDMSYSNELCREMKKWFAKLPGVDILVGDAGRGFLETFRMVELGRYRVPADYDDSGQYFVNGGVYRASTPG